MPLSYGAFYTGWNNFLLGKKLLIEPVSQRETKDIRQFKLQCEAIAKVLENQTYPASYYGGIWPADAMLCAASLSLHDKIFEPTYSEILSTWIKEVQAKLDKNGLIPHSVNYSDQTVAEEARGSSQSLILIFLKEIDSVFAENQFKTYRSLFIDTHLGLTGIREYPKGVSGEGDVDSGPLIFQIGGAATIVGLQTTSMFGDFSTSKKINGTVEAFGICVSE